MRKNNDGAEIDLILNRHGRLYGVECKCVDAPKLTPSMRIAMADLRLYGIAVVYPGQETYALADRVKAVPLDAAVRGMAGLFPR